jgi:hypothetical protein
MRLIITLLVIAAAGYVGWTVYQDKLAKQTEPSAETATTTTGDSSAPTSANPSKGESPPRAPAEKRIAPPGVYYMLDRVTVEHSNGIAAAVPGNQVKLMQRKGNGVVKVTTGQFDFEVKESQLTNDIDLAQEVERKYAIAHPLKR